jgi:DNA replication protein DnaC
MSKDLTNKYNFDSIEIDERTLDRITDELKSDRDFMAEVEKRGIPSEIIRDNLAYFLDFYDTIKHCPKCKDKDNCPLNNKHYPTDLVYLDGNLQRLMGFCPLILSENEFKSHYVISDFPDDYLKARLDNINATRERDKYIKALLNIQQGSKNWVYVYGPDGRGKLYLAVSLLNTLIDENSDIKVGVIDYPKFIKDNTLNYYDNKPEIDRLLNEISNVDYLVIKDFGSEEINSLVVEGITMPLIQQLSRNGAVVIFVSNLSKNDLRQIYDSKPKTKVLNNLILRYIDDKNKTDIKLTGMWY